MVVKAHIDCFCSGGGGAGKNRTLTIVVKQCFELSYPRQWLCAHRVDVYMMEAWRGGGGGASNNAVTSTIFLGLCFMYSFNHR